MEIKFANDGPVPVYSPVEVLAFRSYKQGKGQYTLNEPPSQTIAEEIEKIVRVHGLFYYKTAFELANFATDELLYRYDFKLGSSVCIIRGLISEKTYDDQEKMSRVLEYLLAVLSALGWMVTLEGQREGFYFLNFAPLLIMTPEEVELEIKHKIDQIAFRALQAINPGLLRRQSYYTSVDLGLPKDINAYEFDRFYDRLRELLPGWIITLADSNNRIRISPSTPQ